MDMRILGTTVFLLLSCLVSQLHAQLPYDVREGHWAAAAVRRGIQSGLFRSEGGRFKGNQRVNRYQLAVVADRLQKDLKEQLTSMREELARRKMELSGLEDKVRVIESTEPPQAVAAPQTVIEEKPQPRRHTSPAKVGTSPLSGDVERRVRILEHKLKTMEDFFLLGMPRKTDAPDPVVFGQVPVQPNPAPAPLPLPVVAPPAPVVRKTDTAAKIAAIRQRQLEREEAAEIEKRQAKAKAEAAASAKKAERARQLAALRARSQNETKFESKNLDSMLDRLRKKQAEPKGSFDYLRPEVTREARMKAIRDRREKLLAAQNG